MPACLGWDPQLHQMLKEGKDFEIVGKLMDTGNQGFIHPSFLLTSEAKLEFLGSPTCPWDNCSLSLAFSLTFQNQPPWHTLPGLSAPASIPHGLLEFVFPGFLILALPPVCPHLLPNPPSHLMPQGQCDACPPHPHPLAGSTGLSLSCPWLLPKQNGLIPVGQRCGSSCPEPCP